MFPYRQILDEVAALHDRIHVVDFHGRVAAIEATGLEVGGRTLTVGKFGGFLSTDGVHEALYPEDPYSPDAALAAGVDPAACGGS